MGALILRRLLSIIPLLLLVSFGVFMLVALVPGDAAVTLAGGENATPERIAAVRAELHLDDPLVEQYGRWLGDAVQGDLGQSLFTDVPLTDDLVDRLPITIGLVLAALVVGLVIGVPLGVVSALRAGRSVDSAGTRRHQRGAGSTELLARHRAGRRVRGDVASAATFGLRQVHDRSVGVAAPHPATRDRARVSGRRRRSPVSCGPR